MPAKGDIVVRTNNRMDARFQRKGEIFECVRFKRGMTNINQPRLKVGDRVRIGKVEKSWHSYTGGLDVKVGEESKVASLDDSCLCLYDGWAFPLYALTKIEQFREGDIVTIISGESYGLWVEENEIFELGGEFWAGSGKLGGMTRQDPDGNGSSEKMEGLIRHCTPEEIEHFTKVGRGAKTTDVGKRIGNSNYSKNKLEKDGNAIDSKAINGTIPRRTTEGRHDLSFGGRGNGLEPGDRKRRKRSVNFGEGKKPKGKGLCPGRRTKRVVAI